MIYTDIDFFFVIVVIEESTKGKNMEPWHAFVFLL
jgi:hypothetical protein